MHVPHKKPTNYYQFGGENAEMNINYAQEETMSSNMDIYILLLG